MKLALILAALTLSAPIARAREPGAPAPRMSLEEFMCGKKSCDRSLLVLDPPSALTPLLVLVPLAPSYMGSIPLGPGKYDSQSIPLDPATMLSNTIEIPTSDPGIEQGGMKESSCYRGEHVADGLLKAAIHDGKAQLIYCEVI